MVKKYADLTHAVVIDFETANGCPSSVCSVGVVIVRDGEVVDSFYSLIHPYPDYYAWFCCGLGPGLLSAGIRFIIRWWKAIHE